MTRRYMLDTNIVSHIMQGRDAGVLSRLSQIPVGQAVMSSVTLAELDYGLHRKGQPARLKNALLQVLLRVDMLPWNEAAARCYGRLCALEAQCINLSDLDMMIAAHCVATDTTLVSRDKAFQTVASIEPEKLPLDQLRLEVWQLAARPVWPELKLRCSGDSCYLFRSCLRLYLLGYSIK